MGSGSGWKTPSDIERDIGMLTGPNSKEYEESTASAAEPIPLYGPANIDLIERSIYRNRERNRDERLLFQPAPAPDFNLDMERKKNEDYKRAVTRKIVNSERNAVISQFTQHCVAEPSVPALNDDVAFPPLLKK